MTTSKVPAAAAAAIVGLSLAWAQPGSAADRSQSRLLSDSQLDGVSAGKAARAEGDGRAEGGQARTEVSLSSSVNVGGPTGGAAIGRAAASASASGGAAATATSTLSLSVSLR